MEFIAHQAAPSRSEREQGGKPFMAENRQAAIRHANTEGASAFTERKGAAGETMVILRAEADYLEPNRTGMKTVMASDPDTEITCFPRFTFQMNDGLDIPIVDVDNFDEAKAYAKSRNAQGIFERLNGETVNSEISLDLLFPSP